MHRQSIVFQHQSKNHRLNPCRSILHPFMIIRVVGICRCQLFELHQCVTGGPKVMG